MIEPVVYISHEEDPYWNLSLESHLFKNIKKQQPILLIWRALPSVILGRNQNAWKEVNIPVLKESEYDLLRRVTGGGTVVHDLGNLNLSFISGEKLDHRENLSVIQNALLSLGVRIDINQRNDLLYENKKISGSAYRETRGGHLHHATLLIDSDLKKISQLLKKMEISLSCRSVDSVRSEVTNLKKHFPFLDINLVIQSISEHYSLSKEVITKESFRFEEEHHWRDQKWRWWHKGSFSFSFEIENKELEVEVEKGIVKSFLWDGSSQESFIGSPFTEENLKKDKDSLEGKVFKKLLSLSPRKQD